MSADNPPQQTCGADISLPVKYQRFAGREYNRDFKGSGTVIAETRAAAFHFTGRGRDLFSRGMKELDIPVADITNVSVTGRLVRFSTTQGVSGKSRQPFVFYCRDADDAAAIASLLPKGHDEDFLASRDFAEKLQQLSGPGHPGFSVTNILIGTNVAVFLLMAGVFGAGWVDVTDLTPYIRYGANNAAATTDGEWWRLITSMFLHYGIVHLALNMWALFQSGHLVEKLLGARPSLH
jgi:rhomboid protease GluP